MKPSVFNLIFTVFLLWMTIQVDHVIELYLAYTFILTMGIIHGANDISLISLLTKSNTRPKALFIFMYVCIIILMSLTFFIFPLIALLIFIIFSCYHFGEQHFYDSLKQSTKASNLLFMGYGILILGLLFFLNSEDTTAIIAELTQIIIPNSYYLYFLLFGVILTLITFYFNLKNFKISINYFQEIFLLLLFALIFQLASLLWAFTIYFIIWHSLPSVKDQIAALYGSFSMRNVLKYIKSSLIYWLFSVIGLYIIYYFSSKYHIQFITLFFAFLAAITIPHVIVMYYLNKN